MTHRRLYYSDLTPTPHNAPHVEAVVADIARMYPGNHPLWFWPDRSRTLFTITGPKLTARQASEVIRRTDFSLWGLRQRLVPHWNPNPQNSAEQKLAAHLSAPFDAPLMGGQSAVLALHQEDLRWASAWGLLPGAFSQYFVRSPFSDQFMGWCHPTGVVAYVGFLEDDPTPAGLVCSLCNLGQAFPWLSLEVGAYRQVPDESEASGGEDTEHEPFEPVAGLRLDKGTVQAVQLHGDSKEDQAAYFAPIYAAQNSLSDIYAFDANKAIKEQGIWNLDEDGPFPDKPQNFYWSLDAIADMWAPHITAMHIWRDAGTPVMPFVPSPDPEATQ